MSAEKLACLGQTAKFEECFGPDAEITREIGEAACMSCVVGAFRELSQKVDLLAEENGNLRGQAERDGLTELLNRRMFDIALEDRIKAKERFGLLFLDVEFFKEVNKRRRHVGGDDVLKHTASYLEDFFSSTLRHDDVIARIGGDEFGVILNPSRKGNVLVNSQVISIKERLTRNFLDLPIVRDYNEQYGDDSPLGLHIGHSLWEPGMTAIDMLSEAEPKPDRHAISN